MTFLFLHLVGLVDLPAPCPAVARVRVVVLSHVLVLSPLAGWPRRCWYWDSHERLCPVVESWFRRVRVWVVVVVDVIAGRELPENVEKWE